MLWNGTKEKGEKPGGIRADPTGPAQDHQTLPQDWEA